MTEHTISALCTRSHEISKSKGWLENPRPFHTLCLLMHTEVSEACEDWRNNYKPAEIYYELKIAGHPEKAPIKDRTRLAEDFGVHIDDVSEPKPCGIPIEIADIVIRIAQWAGTAGIGEKLEEEYGHISRGCKPMTDDFEEVLAWTHVDIAKATDAEWRLRNDKTDAELMPVAGVPSDQHPRVVHYLAQAMWRLFTLSDAHKIDLWSAIDEKEAFNKTRPMMHGGKKI